MSDANPKKVELELMWEAIESFYFAYSNGWSYLKKLDGWYPYVEQTHLLDFKGRSVRCYLDRHEMKKASKAALPNLLDPAWVARFEARTHELLAIADAFVEECHLRSVDLERDELQDRIRRGTKILYESLLLFMITQPQYSWEAEPHLLSLLPELPVEEKRNLIALLSQNAESTLITKEEDAWALLVEGVKEAYDTLPDSAEIGTTLDEHARVYGLVYAADGSPFATRTSLYARLSADWNRTDLITKDRAESQKRLRAEQEVAIHTHSISDEAVNFARTLGLLAHLRLETRLRGWMPLERIVVDELLPELARFVPYTPRQLESMTPDELAGVMDGALNPTADELEHRAKHVVAGIYEGKEVLWVGQDAEEKMKPLLPVVDLDAKELAGQPAMKGKATGPCHIISWELDVSANQIDDMPEGAVLVAGQTRPQLMGAIKKACAIVTDEGGVLSHAAIVSRELRIPCVIGTKYATKIFKTGDMVEVDANTGIVRKLSV